MIQPLISVIVPIYNVEKYLRACVDSILAQNYSNLEVILVDDGSPDGCPAICDEYARQDNRVRVIHQKNGGLSAARNAGIDACHGDYLTFVDSDEFIHPDYVDILLNTCKDTGCDVSIGKIQRVQNNGDLSLEDRRSLMDAPIDILTGRETNFRLYTNLYWTRTIMAQGKLYSRRLWKNVHFPIVPIHEDEALIYQILYCARTVAYIDTAIYFYRSNPEGLMANRFSEKRLVLLDILDARLKFYNKMNEPTLCLLTKNREFFTAVEYYQVGLRDTSINKNLLHSFRKKMYELYGPLMRSSYPLKRKILYTMAVLAPSRFTRLYCQKE